MAMTREDMIDWLVEDSADTCRRDDGYLRSILREHWSGMTDEELRCTFRDLAPDDRDDEPKTADRASRPTVNLRFRPQAWVNDYAISVDPEHPDTWDVPLAMLLKRFPTEQDWNDHHNDRDDMRFEGTASQWVRDWSGPFEVEIADGYQPWEGPSS